MCYQFQKNGQRKLSKHTGNEHEGTLECQEERVNINGYEFEQAPGDGEGQGGLACCGPPSYEESDKTERLNNK